MEDVAVNALHKYGAGGHLNFANFILIVMRAVEEYSAESKSEIAGEDKLRMAQEWMPRMLNRAVQDGLCSQDEADKMEVAYHAVDGTAEVLMNTYATLSKNPAFIQLKKKMSGCCCVPKKA